MRWMVVKVDGVWLVCNDNGCNLGMFTIGHMHFKWCVLFTGDALYFICNWVRCWCGWLVFEWLTCELSYGTMLLARYCDDLVAYVIRVARFSIVCDLCVCVCACVWFYCLSVNWNCHIHQLVNSVALHMNDSRCEWSRIIFVESWLLLCRWFSHSAPAYLKFGNSLCVCVEKISIVLSKISPSAFSKMRKLCVMKGGGVIFCIY